MEYDTFQKTDQAKDNFYILQIDLNNLYGICMLICLLPEESFL